MQMVIYIVQRVRRRAAPVMRTRTPAVRRSDQRAMGRVALRLSSPRAMTCTSASGISSNRRNRTLSLALRGARTSAYSFTGFVRALYFLLLRTPFLTYLPTHSLTLSRSLSLSLSISLSPQTGVLRAAQHIRSQATAGNGELALLIETVGSARANTALDAAQRHRYVCRARSGTATLARHSEPRWRAQVLGNESVALARLERNSHKRNDFD